MADVGIIGEHVVGVGLSSGKSYEFGEGGVPEAVIPQKDWGKGNGGGGDTHNHFYIQAVDAKSFSDLVRRNPGAIVGVVGEDLKGNGPLRSAMRSAL